MLQIRIGYLKILYLMSWRTVAGRANFQLFCHWNFPRKTADEIWSIQSSPKFTYDQLALAYATSGAALLTIKTDTVNGAYEDGIFQKPAFSQVLQHLKGSKFIAYNIVGTGVDHYVSYIYLDDKSRWVPLQAYNRIINLGDWLTPFDRSPGLMEQTLTSITGMDPITHPKKYWNTLWKQFQQYFDKYELTDTSNQEVVKVKAQKKKEFPTVYNALNGSNLQIKSAFYAQK